MSYLTDSVNDVEQTVTIDLSKRYTEHEILCSGWLIKRGGSKGGYKNWKKRYFTLNKEALVYFKDENMKKAYGMLPTKNLSATVIGETTKNTFAFVTFEQTMYIKTIYKDDKNKWINAITQLKTDFVDEARKLAETEKERRNTLSKSDKYKETEMAKVVSSPNSESISKSETDNSLSDNQKKNREIAKNRSEMNTVNAILEDELGVKHFLAYLKTEYCDFHLSFWLKTKHLLSVFDAEEKRKFPCYIRKELLRICVSINDEFVYEGVDRSINIPKNIRDPILKWNGVCITLLESRDIIGWNQEYTSKIFSEVVKMYQVAQLDVFNSLRGSYRRFKKTKFFSDLTQELSKESELYEHSEIIRGACLRVYCNCRIYLDNNSSISVCQNCQHFYEEHQNLTETTKTLESTDSKGLIRTSSAVITSEQRQKLKMLLGTSALKITDNNETENRKKFLIGNVTGILNHPSNPLVLKSHRVNFTKHPKCFSGKEFIEKLQARLKISKKETVIMAEEMMSYNIFIPIVKSQKGFINGKFYYKLTDDVKEEIEKRSLEVEVVDSESSSTSFNEKTPQEFDLLEKDEEEKTQSLTEKDKQQEMEEETNASIFELLLVEQKEKTLFPKRKSILSEAESVENSLSGEKDKDSSSEDSKEKTKRTSKRSKEKKLRRRKKNSTNTEKKSKEKKDKDSSTEDEDNIFNKFFSTKNRRQDTKNTEISEDLFKKS